MYRNEIESLGDDEVSMCLQLDEIPYVDKPNHHIPAPLMQLYTALGITASSPLARAGRRNSEMTGLFVVDLVPDCVAVSVGDPPICISSSNT